MSQPKMHQVQNYRDGASTTTTTYSDVTCASGYHSYFGRDMQDYTVVARIIAVYLSSCDPLVGHIIVVILHHAGGETATFHWQVILGS